MANRSILSVAGGKLTRFPRDALQPRFVERAQVVSINGLIRAITVEHT